ncbi:MAG: hypothetical protein C4518_04510 [Desulfobacteraceae bacterium]|nr:MAG: hypothetical protein C4518_04510 [Desulfobacteraceae bacterium]
MPVYETETRGKIRVPSTNRQRVRQWREKKAKEGGKNLSVWMEPETVKQMDELLERLPDEDKTSIIALAIRMLHEQHIS